MKELEEYAMINKIPIMQKDGILYLCNYIKENNIKNILEIGSAIGYSSIMMANVNDNIMVTTIERDIDRYNIAIDNINKYNKDKQINIIYGDATEVDITGKYDLIFIDAAKGQYTRFFEKYQYFLKDTGVIITDNLKFHGYVGKSDTIESKNLRQLVSKIESYIDFLKNNADFETTFYDIGDGLSVSKKRNHE